MRQLSGDRLAVLGSATVLLLLQVIGPFGALVTGGIVIIVLAGASAIMVLRPRPRGWIMAGGLLAGVSLFVLPWSLFVAQRLRAADSDAGAWPIVVAAAAVLALAASAWLLRRTGSGQWRAEREWVASLAGILTLLGGAVALAIAGSALVRGTWGVSAALAVGAAVLLRTLRVAPPARHLADLVVATGLASATVWWVFVGTLQAATGGVGMIAVATGLLIVLSARTSKSFDMVRADGTAVEETPDEA